MKKTTNTSSAVNGLLDVISDMIKKEASKLDSTIVCKVASINTDGTYRVYVEPDESNIISSIGSIVTDVINVGDYVYVYKIKNQLNNSFIIKKITSQKQQTVLEKIQELQNNQKDMKKSIESLGASAGTVSGGGTIGYEEVP